MKIVKVYGGLGNQMFQLAFAMSLAARQGGGVHLDPESLEAGGTHNGYELERLFGTGLPRAPRADCARLAVPPTGLVNRLRRKYLTKPSQVIDRRFKYQPELLEIEGDAYYEGYWQSEKYFKPIEDEVRKAFSFRPPLSERNRELAEGLARPVASLHVRRGDYLEHPNLDICTPAYYGRAIDAMRDSVASFLVFSDDIEYCRRELRLGGAKAVFVDWNRGEDSWQDMALMALCDHHIVANSSFSWWGAWLDPKPAKRVVAPSIWNRREISDRDRYYDFGFGDVVPEAWERVEI